MQIVKADKKAIALAVQCLREGKSVVYPTDTSYGLGIDVTNMAAVRKLYRIKQRSLKQPVHVIVASLAMAKKYVKFDKIALRVFKKLLPGPLTLVLPRLPLGAPSPGPSSNPPGDGHYGVNLGRGRGEVESWKILSGGTGTVGIRMPKNHTALSLVKNFGQPITTTSANLSGGITPYSIQEVIRQFRGRKYQPDLILDAGILPKHKPSTMIRVAGERIDLIRKGPITKKVILSALGGEEFLDSSSRSIGS